MKMTFREEFKLLQKDETYTNLFWHSRSLPIFEMERWQEYCERCGDVVGDARMKSASKWLIASLTEVQLLEFRHTCLIMADRAEECGCELTAMMLRGEDNGNPELVREYDLPRSAYMRYLHSK